MFARRNHRAVEVLVPVLVLSLAFSPTWAQPAAPAKPDAGKPPADKPEIGKPEAAAPAAPPAAAKLAYPKTKTVDQVDELHGVKVADRYRWLEDLDSAETKAWVEEQNKITFGFLEQIPQREPIKQRLTHLWNYEKYGTPIKEGNRYFYAKNDGLQPQAVVYVTESLTGEPRVLIDPNRFSKDGTVALTGTYIHESGKKLVYGVSEAGSDWLELRVRDVDRGEDLPDVIKWVKFSGASWTKDGRGFFYSRYDEPSEAKMKSANYFQKLYFHEIGKPQDADKLIHHEPEHGEWSVGGYVTEDGQYLVLVIGDNTKDQNLVWCKPMDRLDAEPIKLVDEFNGEYNVIGNDGPVFYVWTDFDAPRGRLLAIDARRPERANWRDLIPQGQDALRGVGLVGDQFFAMYLKDAHTDIRLFDLAGKHLRDVELPGLGTAGGFGGRRTDNETFYSFTSYNYPATIFRYDLASGKSEVYRRPKVDFDPEQYESKQVFYNSKDGTRVPMFLTYKKGLKLDGGNPTLLYGYGGFNAALTPGFSVARLVWLEMGGVYAVACLRGGGEYGKEWHDAGKLKNKQNVYDDFIAAAEWLIANKYTSTPKLAISGASNGGLLVGACMNQRPDLFGACLPAVGVMDMLRFTQFTIGWSWVSDYGDPNDPEMFQVLHAYSPLHNLKPGTCYPPTLVTTADHDDRVVPAHSFKYIAALQVAQGCDNPVLIRIETRAGHGAGRPTQKIIETVTDEYAFLVRTLKMEPEISAPPPPGHVR